MQSERQRNKDRVKYWQIIDGFFVESPSVVSVDQTVFERSVALSDAYGFKFIVSAGKIIYSYITCIRFYVRLGLLPCSTLTSLDSRLAIQNIHPAFFYGCVITY